MSAGVGVWKEVLLKVAHIPARKAAVATPPVVSSAAPVASLVRQVFFPAAMLQRTYVLFAAADAQTRVSAVCEQVGLALAAMSGATVGIVEADSPSLPFPSMKKAPRNTAGAEWWRSYSSQIAKNLWRVPSALMTQQPQVAGGLWISAETGALPFDYVLFAAIVSDSDMPLFCSVCDGAVLVLTANRTRKDAALRAKEHLMQCNGELLGTVLDGRTFPVPEAIYQRL